MATLKKIDTTGLTLYVILRNASLQLWNTATTAIEAFNAVNYTSYDIAATEQGSTGFYSATSPATLPVGAYSVDWRSQQGGSPAQSDPCIGLLSAYWDGTNWFADWAVKLAQSASPVADSPESNVKDALADTNEIQGKLPSRAYLAGSTAATGETQTDAAAAITAYDPPTNSEMELRTKLAADYADKTTLDIAAADVAGLDGAAMRGTDSAMLAASYTAPDNANISVAATQATNAAADAATIKGKLPAAGAAIGTSTFDPTTQEVTPTTASKTGYALSTAGALAVLNSLTSGLTTVGGLGKWLLDTMLLRTTWTDARAAKLDNLDGTSLGTGARTVTITVTDGTNPLEGARVRMTSGAESYVGTSSALGVVTFSLDDATWTVVITKALYTFTSTTLVVNGVETQTYAMTAVSVAASDPGYVTGYFYCYDESGAVQQGAKVYLRFDSIVGDTGHAWDMASRTGTSDANGLVQFANLMPSATYIAKRGTGPEKQISIASGATGTVALGTIWGVDA